VKNKPGLILSKEEGRLAKDDVRALVEAEHIDIVTAIEIQWDITCRTVPIS
jgi:hypothetical protein